MRIRSAAVFGALFLTLSASASDLSIKDYSSTNYSSREMETITVSATPIRVDDAGASVTIITREEMDRRNTSIQSLLRSIPGFSVSQQGSAGAVTQLRVRGAEANQVLVMINGIEANDLSQGSEFDFSQISLSDVERIEIVRGPQSALWGSDAMAGVVHIITRPGDDPSGISASVEAGSFSSQRATLTAQMTSDRNRLKFSADHRDTDGSNISRQGGEEDGLENLTVSLTGRYTPVDNLTLDYTIRHTDKTSDFDSIDFFTTGLPVDADNSTRSRYAYSGFTLTHVVSESFDHSLSLSRSDSWNKTDPTDDVTEGTRDAIRYQFNYLEQIHRISVRAEYEKEDFRQRGAASFFGDPNQNQETSTNSIAAEYRYGKDDLNISVSARRDDNSDFDNSSSWRVTGNYKLDNTTFYASVGESIKNPTFAERYGFYTNFIGNPNLRPEQSRQWEVGARTSMLENRLNIALAWFDASLKREINGFVFDAATAGFTAANVDGESSRQGAEVAIAYHPTDHLSFSTAYTYLDATQPDFAGQDVTEVRRPKHSGSITMNYSWENAGLSLSVIRTGTQEDDFFPPFPPYQERVRLPGFTLAELSGYYNLTSNLTLTVRTENLMDEDYEQVYGFQSPGFGGYVGLRYSW